MDEAENKWRRALWEKTGLCEIIACYDLDEPKAIWQPWADWCVENFFPLRRHEVEE